MTLVQLEYALALWKHGTFVKAAKSMSVSQPALSMQIRKLEEELDLVLFDRSGKRVEISENGIAFLQRAQLLLNEARQLKDLAGQLNENIGGTLRIGIIPTLAPYLVPLFINELNTKYSQLKIAIQEALTEEILNGLQAGTLDGGVISTPIQATFKYEVIPLFYEPFKLFVANNHLLADKKAIQVSEIPTQDIWLLKEGNCFRDQVNNICDIVKPGKESTLFSFESSSIESLCRIVEFKGGLTFLPELTTLFLDDEKEEMIKDIEGVKQVREISLLHLPNHIRSTNLGLFADIIRANIPKNLLEKGEAISVPTKVGL